MYTVFGLRLAYSRIRQMHTYDLARPLSTVGYPYLLAYCKPPCTIPILTHPAHLLKALRVTRVFRTVSGICKASQLGLVTVDQIGCRRILIVWSAVTDYVIGMSLRQHAVKHFGITCGVTGCDLGQKSVKIGVVVVAHTAGYHLLDNQPVRQRIRQFTVKQPCKLPQLTTEISGIFVVFDAVRQLNGKVAYVIV